MSIPQGQQGPASPDPVAPAGYERSPAGAALAAMSAVVRSSVASDEQWPRVGQLIEPGERRDLWSINRAQISIVEPVKAAQAPQIVAYRIADYSKDTAVVHIVTEQPDKSLTENTAQVAWQAGDWYLRLPASGASDQVKVLDSLPGDVIELKEAD